MANMMGTRYIHDICHIYVCFYSLPSYFTMHYPISISSYEFYLEDGGLVNVS